MLGVSVLDERGVDRGQTVWRFLLIPGIRALRAPAHRWGDYGWRALSAA